MATLRTSVFLSYLLPHLASASPLTLRARDIAPACRGNGTDNCVSATAAPSTKTGVVSGATITETFFPTSLSDLASVTAQTTVTTTDSAGAAVVAIVGAGGAGYLVYEALGAGAGGGLDPPEMPTEPEPTPDPTTTSPPEESTTSSTTEENTLTAEQTGIFYTNTVDSLPTLISIPVDVKSCNAADQGAKFDEETAKSSISSFCGDKSNQDVGSATVDQVFSLGAGMELNLTVSALPLGCDSSLNQTWLSEDHCEYYLSEALNNCDSDDGKHGGNIQNGCLQYSIAAQTTPGELECSLKDLPQLPGIPGTSSDEIKYADETGSNRDEALSHIEAFCKNITDGDGRSVTPREYEGLRYYYNPSRGNSQMNISLTYSDQTECPQDGDSASYKTTHDSCVALLDRTIDGCDTDFTGSYGKFGGMVTDGCGMFAARMRNVEPIECSSGASPSSDDVNAAIDQFCGRGYTLDPDADVDDGKFHQTPPDGTAYDNYVISQSARIFTQATFDSLDANTGCQITKTKFAVKGDECKRRLHDIANQCKSPFTSTEVIVVLILSDRRKWWQDGCTAGGRLRALGVEVRLRVMVRSILCVTAATLASMK